MAVRTRSTPPAVAAVTFTGRMTTSPWWGRGPIRAGELGCGSDRASSRPIRRATVGGARGVPGEARHGALARHEARVARDDRDRGPAAEEEERPLLRASDSSRHHLAAEDEIVGRGSGGGSSGRPVWKSKFYGAIVLASTSASTLAWIDARAIHGVAMYGGSS